MAMHRTDHSPDGNGREPIPQTERICEPPSEEYRKFTIDDAQPEELIDALHHILNATIHGCHNTSSHLTHLHLWEQDQGHGFILQMHCPDCNTTWKL